MSRFYFVGSNAMLDETVRDADGNLINADTITVTAVDSAGAPITVGTPTAATTGNYAAKAGLFAVGGDGTATWTITVSGFTTVDMYTFTVLTTAPVATAVDLSTYMGQTVDVDRATFLLYAAQALCETVTAPLPTGAGVVVCRMAAAAYANPTGAKVTAIGTARMEYGSGSPVSQSGVILTTQDRKDLRRLAGGSTGAFSFDPVPADALSCLPFWDVTFIPAESA